MRIDWRSVVPIGSDRSRFEQLHGRVAGLCVLIGALAVGQARSSQAATGLSFLEIGAGARAVALGDAVVSNVSDPSASYWNPGALALMDRTSAEVTHNESFRDVRYEFAGLTHGFGRSGAGLAFHGVWSDDIPKTDDTGRNVGTFAYYGVVLSGSYAYALTDQIGLGVGVEYLREVVDEYVADGVAGNVGIQWRELLPRTDFGAALLHVGSSLEYETESFDLPLIVQGGLTHTVPLAVADGSLRVACEVRAVRDDDTSILFGTEYQYREFASLQAGYRSGLDTQDVSFGFGFGGNRLGAQYAFVPFGEELGEQHRISLRASW